MGWHPQADRVLTAGDEVPRVRRALEDQGQRAGPETLAKVSCFGRDFARPGECLGRIFEMHDHRVIKRSALDRIETRDRFLIGRIGPKAVHGFGREGDESAGAQDLRGPANLGFHSLSGGLLSTASVCLRRNSSSFFASSLSESASSATAKSAALAAPASPIANVATGIPFGICTVERSESRPWRCLDGIGTPSTGSVV